MAEVASAESGDSKAETKKESTMEVDEEEDDILSDMQKMGANDITARTRLLDNEVRIMKSEIMRLQHEMQAQRDKIKENTEKIKVIFFGFIVKYQYQTNNSCSYYYSSSNQ